MPTIHKPGEICQVSGQYGLVNSAAAYQGREATVVKSERFPPTSTVGWGWVLRDRTIHR